MRSMPIEVEMNLGGECGIGFNSGPICVARLLFERAGPVVSDYLAGEVAEFDIPLLRDTR